MVPSSHRRLLAAGLAGLVAVAAAGGVAVAAQAPEVVPAPARPVVPAEAPFDRVRDALVPADAVPAAPTAPPVPVLADARRRGVGPSSPDAADLPMVLPAPPPPPAPMGPQPGAWGRCPQFEPLLAAHGLPVDTFSHIMFRESRCTPTARSRTRDTGLLQLNDVTHGWLSAQLGVGVTAAWLTDPDNNVRAAAALYRSYGTRPWRATR